MSFFAISGLDEDSGDDLDTNAGPDQNDPNFALFYDDLLTDLPNWFDRLYEGSLRRIKVEEWPLLI